MHNDGAHLACKPARQFGLCRATHAASFRLVPARGAGLGTVCPRSDSARVLQSHAREPMHRATPAAVASDRSGAQTPRMIPLESASPLDRAREFARAQCDPAEIAASLCVTTGMAEDEAIAFVTGNADDLCRHQLAARAELRVYLWRLGRGDPALAREATSTSVTVATALARQHMGWSAEGVDGKLRKLIEKTERQMGKGLGPNGLRLLAP